MTNSFKRSKEQERPNRLAPIPKRNVKKFHIAHLVDDHRQMDPNSWNLESGDTLTIIKDKSEKELLFINHVQIEDGNWRRNKAQGAISWHQGKGPDHISGHLLFNHNETAAHGDLEMGSQRNAIQLATYAPVYNCKVAANTGAHFQTEGEKWELKWDPSADQWKNAKWIDSMKWGYQIAKDNEIPREDATAVVFMDAQTKNCWTPWIPETEEQAPNLYNADFGCSNEPSYEDDDIPYSFLMPNAHRMIFDLFEGEKPEDDRSALPNGDQGITTVFPNKFIFDFDPIYETFVGALLMENENPAEEGVVYGIQGESPNDLIVGRYLLHKSDKTPHAIIAVHDGKLMLNGSKVAESKLIGSSLSWSDISSEEAVKANLPTSGYVDFAKDGKTITGSSFAYKGARVTAKEIEEQHVQLLNDRPQHVSDSPFIVSTETAGLKVNQLFGMHPINEKDANGFAFDKIQDESTKDFYNIIQTFIDDDLYNTFFGKVRPVLSPYAQQLVEGESKENIEFYKSLQVPYIVNAIGLAKDKSAKLLNVRRAGKKIKRDLAMSDVYSKQSSGLYANRWGENFPTMKLFLEDQEDTDYSDTLDQLTKRWQDRIRRDSQGTADPDDAEAQTQEKLDYVQELGDYAKQNNRFWAYRYYKAVTSVKFLTPLRESMTLGGESDSKFFNIKTYSTILTILDPENFYAKKFAEAIQSFLVINMLSTWVDYGGNAENFNEPAETILNKFLEKYVNSGDKKVADTVAEIRKFIAEKGATDVFNDIRGAIQAAGNASRATGGIWGNYTFIFRKELTARGLKYGSRGSTLFATAGYLFMGASMSFAIYGLATGSMKWDDLSPTQKAGVIAGGISFVAHTAFAIIKRIVTFKTVINEFGTTIEGSPFLKFFVKGEVPDIEGLTQGMINKLRSNEIVDISKNIDEVGVAFEKDAEIVARGEQAGLLLERNITRLAKVAAGLSVLLGILNLVLSAIALAGDTDKKSKIVDGMFVGAASIEVIGAVFGFLATMVTSEAIGAAFGIVAGALGVVGVIAAVVGLILMFVLPSPPPPDPIGDFARDQAKKAGFYMPEGTDIDYFQAIIDKNTGIQATGVSVRLNQDTNTALQLSEDHKSWKVGSVSNSFDTVFSLTTDEFGYASIFTRDPKAKGVRSVLAIDKNGNLTTEAQDDPQMMKWKATIIPGTAKIRDKKQLEYAQFELTNVKLGATKKLTVDLGSRTLTLQENPKLPNWQLVMTGVKPEGLNYQALKMRVADTDRHRAPVLHQKGADPKTWSIDAGTPLPDFLKLNTKNGVIEQIKDKKVSQLAKKSITVHVSNQFGATQGSIDISVTA